MQLVTWNLNGLEDRYLDERTEAAMFNILLGAPIEKAIQEGFSPNTPDIIVLQEVVHRTFHAHITPHLQAACFNLYPTEPSERSYFEVVATRLPITESNYTPFEYSDQGRGLTTFNVKDHTTEVQVMTAHLESMKPSASMRIDQSEVILRQMNESKIPCIFAGDTNLRKKEWQSLAANKVKDAWEIIGSPKNYKSTWFSDNRKARYDRVWTSQIDVKKFALFGGNKIPSIKEPSSDHHAIRVDFEIKN